LATNGIGKLSDKLNEAAIHGLYLGSDVTPAQNQLLKTFYDQLTDFLKEMTFVYGSANVFLS
jgi:hypothetical protein